MKAQRWPERLRMPGIQPGVSAVCCAAHYPKGGCALAMAKSAAGCKTALIELFLHFACVMLLRIVCLFCRIPVAPGKTL